ncbi:hypothetical protein HYFRA_00010379 [Hymenoscyphus fraxineus]|uniref:Uncharacterized protein n=1 Tax=Hymenoscyphus fraxineus TaxID=746836 RepID=A0A9N9L3I7_9HELO|nr:hypothetical protein HYFRA_00010379 [Hymenoscyphus fraxineus]
MCNVARGFQCAQILKEIANPAIIAMESLEGGVICHSNFVLYTEAYNAMDLMEYSNVSYSSIRDFVPYETASNCAM